MRLYNRPVHFDRLYLWGLLLLLGAAGAAFVALLFVPAPYGRHARRGFGPELPTRLAWVIQELPAPVVFALVFLRGEHAAEVVPLVFVGLWQLHYLQRTFVFPLLMRTGGKGTPLATAILAFLFNCLNASLNAYADAILRRLRKPGETGYKIPTGGLFRFVSCPNYLGEIVEWCGWALATWTYAGALFAIFTLANLAPRAIAHHRWYRERFPDYPNERKALVPGFL